MKKIKYISIAFVLGLFTILSSCIKNNTDDPEYCRVVVLYLAANNNLSSYASNNIVSLKEGYLPGEDSKDIVLIYSHLSGSNPKLLRLYKDDSGKVQEDVVANFDSQNSATPQVLENLLNKVKIIFPAEEYGLILWSHASGWLPQGYYSSPTGFNAYMPDPYAGIVKSFGEDSGIEMEITDLKDAIPYHLSFIIFDCCFMGGIETAYELKDKCDYIVASPTEILATGFPYDQVMKPLFESTADLNETCQIFYDYYNGMNGANKSATIAIYQTDKLQQVAAASKIIFNNNRSKIATLNMSQVQKYFRLDKHWFYDLSDLMESIAMPSEFTNFKSALDNAVIAKWSTDNFIDIKINSFSGISTYIQNPTNSYLDNFYKGYQWNRDSEMIK